MMSSLIKKILILSAVSALTACSVLSPVETPQQNYYVFNTVPKIKTHPGKTKTILVTPSQAKSLYDSTNMAYTKQAYQVSYFVNNHWAETPARMLNALIFQTLQDTHHFKAVVSAPFMGKYDYTLNTQLLELQQDFMSNPSIVRIRIRAQLLNAKTDQLIANKEISVSIPAPANTPYGGVTAANQAVAEILRQLAAFCMV